TICNILQIQLAMRFLFFFKAEDGIRDRNVTGVQTCALPISHNGLRSDAFSATGFADDSEDFSFFNMKVNVINSRDFSGIRKKRRTLNFLFLNLSKVFPFTNSFSRKEVVLLLFNYISSLRSYYLLWL